MAENMEPLQENIEEKHSLKREIYDWMQCIVTALVACILIFTFVGRVIGVDGGSMLPTLEDGDKIIITGLHGELEYGDIVVLTKREFSREPIVKRVIATEGQTVDINFNTGEVQVDGVVLDEPYINEPTKRQLNVKFPVTVPEDCIFVMGDNRNKSSDSRDSTIGFVDTRCVLGKAVNIIWPASRFGKMK